MGWSKNHLLGSSMSLEFMVKTYNRCISQRLHRISSQNADLHDVYEQRKSWKECILMLHSDAFIWL